MNDPVMLDGETLTVPQVVEIARHHRPIRLSDAAIARVERARSCLERLVVGGEIVYGVNTGVGSLGNVSVPSADVEALQRNILRSHAAGTGPPVATEVVRAMLVLRANALAKGHSGICAETLRALVDLLNRGVTPIVPSLGSVGASGDLAPLSHAALVLIGEGAAELNGERLSGAEAMRRAGLDPVPLRAKEGLALNNGTQFTAAFGVLALHDAERLLRTGLAAAALTMEAMRALRDPWDPRVHAVRPHPGALAIAAALERLLEESRYTIASNDIRSSLTWRGPQDPYSVRAIPQVLGACVDMLRHVREVMEVEINAATDDPLVFAGERQELFYCANFHAQPVAAALDVAALAVATLGAMSERRTALLVDGALSHGLPSFLVHPDARPGVNTGLMIAQITAAALSAELKTLAHPASVDSIPTSAGFEDFVSMGGHAGRKAQRAVDLAETLVAIELLVAAQGVDIRGGEHSLGRGTRRVFRAVRSRASCMVEDRVVASDIEAVLAGVRDGAFANCCDPLLALQPRPPS